MPLCVGCGSITVTVSGGIKCGSSSKVTDNKIYVSGGIKCGSSAIVDVAGKLLGMDACYPLGDGPIIYVNTVNSLTNGIGGSPHYPTIDTGLFCLPASHFYEWDGDGEYIQFTDTIGNRPFTVSLWANIEDIYKPRVLVSRGVDDLTTGSWAFTLGYSYLNHPVAAIQKTDGTVIEVYGPKTLEIQRWYHLAAIYTGSTLSVYVGGVLQASVAASNIVTPTQGYIGRWNLGSYPTCKMQEVRMYSEAKNSDWLKAEITNFCDSSFVQFGTVEVPFVS